MIEQVASSSYFSLADLDELSEAGQVLHVVHWVSAEVMNGGFRQFFYNRTAECILQTVLALCSIGAFKTADIVERAIARFPGKFIPSDWEERQAVVETQSARATWTDLDDEFFTYPDVTIAMVNSFIAKHLSLLDEIKAAGFEEL